MLLQTSNLAQRGYQMLFRTGTDNACPGCGHSNWYVGRHSAECAFCETAVPIAPTREWEREQEAA